MANGAVLGLLFMLGVFTKGVCLTSVIQTHQTVMAAVGEDAHFSCQLMQPKDVLQVTWQKLLPAGEKNLATCNKYFGQRVNLDFRDKMEIKDAGLQNSSIVIRNVTDEDKGCYRCLFNAYPDGALSARTCLQLYVRVLQHKTLEVQSLNALPRQELHEPLLHVRESNSTEESVVSTDDVTLIIVVSFVLLGPCGLAAVIYVLYRQKNKIRDPEKNEMPQKKDKDNHAIVTPLIKKVTDQVTQRTSAKKTPRSGRPEPSPSSAKCPRKLFEPS